MNPILKKIKCIIPRNTRQSHTQNIAYIFIQDAIKDQMGTILSQSKVYINKDWALLDNQSTIDFFATHFYSQIFVRCVFI